MRIDFQYTPQPAEPGKSRAQNHETQSPAAEGARVAGGEDQTQFSRARTQVEALAAQASQLPETRRERVDSLRQAVGSGQYRADSAKVAGALLNSLLVARPAPRG